MGNCSDCYIQRRVSEQPRRLARPTQNPPQEAPQEHTGKTIIVEFQQPIPLALMYDQRNGMCGSYKTQNNCIEKIIYNWHSFPITTKIKQSQMSSFSIKNCGIKDDNFVVGIIKLNAINSMIKVPWRTSNTICYESHHQNGQSGIIFENILTPCGRGVRKDEILTVIIRPEKITFRIQSQLLGERDIPSEFFNQQICPYICLFHKEDKIEFLDGISIDQVED